MARSFRAVFLCVLMAGCAQRTPAPIAVAPPPVAVVPPIPLPAGASPGMQIPAMLPDGRYPTPSDSISRPAAVWHLRAALNVAALACRGVAGEAITAHYNALLSQRRFALAGAQAAVASEYRQASGAKWQDAWDDSMTRLYNYYALAPVRADFCAAAERVLAALTNVPPDGLTDYAPQGLAELDRPFCDFFRAYDAWRAQSRGASVALQATVPPAPRPIPVLQVDPAIFR